MNILVITPFEILFVAIAVIILYIVAISILFKKKSGILPYLALLIFPVLAPVGIILGNFKRK
ncbi:hypothetical protein [Chryseobacterium daeguense]|uniref:hypothetical protein n=1 Tax=Chryseobacterium daeguense TaxID=412438 RepID=UPI0003F5E90F|nr:hypothetical protein [Chryseobacterium daeguense]